MPSQPKPGVFQRTQVKTFFEQKQMHGFRGSNHQRNTRQNYGFLTSSLLLLENGTPETPEMSAEDKMKEKKKVKMENRLFLRQHRQRARDHRLLQKQQLPVSKPQKDEIEERRVETAEAWEIPSKEVLAPEQTRWSWFGWF